MTGHAGSLGLYGLGSSYLKSVLGGKGVESHVLGLERGRRVSVLQENPAKSCGYDAFANVASGSGKHYVMQSAFHLECFTAIAKRQSESLLKNTSISSFTGWLLLSVQSRLSTVLAVLLAICI